MVVGQPYWRCYPFHGILIFSLICLVSTAAIVGNWRRNTEKQRPSSLLLIFPAPLFWQNMMTVLNLSEGSEVELRMVIFFTKPFIAYRTMSDMNLLQFSTTMPIRPSLSLKTASTQNIQGDERLRTLFCTCPPYRRGSIRMTKKQSSGRDYTRIWPTMIQKCSWNWSQRRLNQLFSLSKMCVFQKIAAFRCISDIRADF